MATAFGLAAIFNVASLLVIVALIRARKLAPQRTEAREEEPAIAPGDRPTRRPVIEATWDLVAGRGRAAWPFGVWGKRTLLDERGRLGPGAHKPR